MSVLDGCVGWVGRSTVQLQVLMLQCINATDVEQPITLESSDNQITIATIGVVGRGCMALADELNSINFQRCKQAAAGASTSWPSTRPEPATLCPSAPNWTSKRGKHRMQIVSGGMVVLIGVSICTPTVRRATHAGMQACRLYVVESQILQCVHSQVHKHHTKQ
jgi:hypothetical protein